MKIPVTGGIGTTIGSLAIGTTIATVTDDDDVVRSVAEIAKPMLTLGTSSSISLYNGYTDISIELTKSYIESLSDDELYELEAKLTNKDVNIDFEETHSKQV